MALHSREKKKATRNLPPEEPAVSLPQTIREPTPRRKFSIGSVWRFLKAMVRYTLVGTLALLCAGVFFVAVIMGESPELGHDEAENSAVLAEPAPLPGVGEFASQDLSVLASYFPASLAQLDAGSGLVLQQGAVQDVEVEGLICRVVSLRYQVGQDTVTLRSATPAGYLSRFGTADVVLSSDALMLGTLPGISLRTASQQVAMARDGDLLYALEAPIGFSALDQLSAWVVFE